MGWNLSNLTELQLFTSSDREASGCLHFIVTETFKFYTYNFFKKICCYLLILKKEREIEREILNGCLLHIELATQACALTRNGSGDLLVHGRTLSTN